VQMSEWATLGGVPVAAWGVGFYVTALTLALLGLQDPWAGSVRLSQLLMVLSGFGVLFSAFLTSLEAFVIHAWCQWCVVSAIMVTAIFVLSVLDWREQRVESRAQELLDEQEIEEQEVESREQTLSS